MLVSTRPPKRSVRRALNVAGYAVLGALTLLVAVLAVNTLRLSSSRMNVEPVRDLAIDADAAAQRLAGAIALPTVSYEDPALRDSSAFRALHAYLADAFPRAHATLERTPIGELSLLYRWPGRNPSLKPALLTAHLDVVPVDSATAAAWTHAPFSGTVADGYVWGRGALDNKSGVTGLLEAVEHLITKGYTPERTILLAFGHDEEVSGVDGAQQIAARLAAEGTELAYVLDEGGFIVDGMLPGLEAPLAVIGVAEKGYMTLELVVNAYSGHSSTPPQHTAIGALSRAVARLEENPFPPRIEGATAAMYERIAPHLPVMHRVALSNLWLFEPVVHEVLSARPAPNAAMRTTIAPTMITGGVKSNVLPSEARATVNVRILPGETGASVREHVRTVIADTAVQIRTLRSEEPTAVSDSRSPVFRLIEKSVRQVSDEPRLVVSPYLLMGGTDARHYAGLTDHVYRFIGARVNRGVLSSFHGINERIPVREYVRAVETYCQIIRNTDDL